MATGLSFPLLRRCCFPLVLQLVLLALGTSFTFRQHIPPLPPNSIHDFQQSRLFSSQIDYLVDVRGAVQDAGFEKEWKESAALLSESLGLELDAAEACLAETWKWKSLAICKSKIAKKFIKTIAPDSKAVQQALEWLKNGPLALTNEQVKDSIADNPEAYLLNPEKTYHEALKAAPEEYSSPDKFRDLLLKDPSVLACTYNCIDDGCASECGNCWVSYKNRV